LTPWWARTGRSGWSTVSGFSLAADQYGRGAREVAYTGASMSITATTAAPMSLPGLAAWRRTWTAEGVRFVGTEGAVTVAHDRPLPAALLSDLLAPQGADFRRGVTAEGEHVVKFTREGRRIACILGDRHMAVVAAETDAPSLAALVDTLAWTLPLRLGAVRARQFEVTSPSGWSVSTRGLTARLDAPDRSAFLTIPAATPLGALDWTERFLYEDTLVGLAPVQPIEASILELPCGLVGEVVRVVARHRDADAPIAFWTALLHDDRYRYTVRLEAAAPSEALEARFAGVIQTVRPIPRPSPRFLGVLFPID
jgi:hypothetical protein